VTDGLLKGQGPFNDIFYTPGRDGKLVSSFPYGTSLWMMPFYGAGKLLHQLVQYLAPDFQIQKPLFFTSLFVMFLNSFFVASVSVLFFKIAIRMNYGHRTAFIAACLVGFGTTLWPYSKFCFSEPQGAFFLLASFYCFYLLQDACKLKYVALSAIFYGLALVTKYELVILFPAFYGYFLYRLRSEQEKSKLVKFIVYIGVLALFAGSVLAWNYWCYGTLFNFGRYGVSIEVMIQRFNRAVIAAGLLWIVSSIYYQQPRVAEQIRKYAYIPIALLCLWMAYYAVTRVRESVYLFRVFFSPGKGLFVFSPILLIGVIYWKKFFNEHKAEAYFIVSLLALYLALLRNDTIWGWGSRYYVTLIPFLMLPVLSALKEFPSHFLAKGLLAGIILASLGVQVLSISVNYQDSLNLIDRWVGQRTQIPIDSYDREEKIVFSRMLYDPVFSPLVAQSAVLKTVITKKWHKFEEKLSWKPHIRDSKDWRFDFWWVYLMDYPLNHLIVCGIVMALAILALVSFFCVVRLL
jgi:hypothetical protein